MMYEDFNEDEKGRKALDGVWAHVGGAGRGGFNHRFAQPSRDGQPLLHYSQPVDMFPFADKAMQDPLTNRNEGLLTRITSGKTAPKVFYTNGSYEYWGRAASLIHTTPDGVRDIAPDKNTRIYLLAGAQHGAGSLPLKRTNTQNLANPLDQRWLMRALLVAMNSWVKEGVEPPLRSTRRSPKESWSRQARLSIRETFMPLSFRVPTVLDFGPEFRSKGIISIEPPKEGARYAVLLPQVDRDGNELGGVRLPELDVPLGLYTGWNLRGASIGSPDRMIAFIGSFFPYSDVKQRYSGKDAYLGRVKSAAGALVSQRFALQDDVDKMIGRAGELWEAVSGSALVALTRANVRKESRKQPNHRKKRTDLIDEQNVGMVREFAEDGCPKSAHTEGESEEQAGDHPHIAGHQVLRINKDRRKCGRQHHADNDGENSGPEQIRKGQDECER